MKRYDPHLKWDDKANASVPVMREGRTGKFVHWADVEAALTPSMLSFIGQMVELRQERDALRKAVQIAESFKEKMRDERDALKAEVATVRLQNRILLEESIHYQSAVLALKAEVEDYRTGADVEAREADRLRAEVEARAREVAAIFEHDITELAATRAALRQADVDVQALNDALEASEAEYERGRKEESRLATTRCREIVAKVEAERDALAAEVERLRVLLKRVLDCDDAEWIDAHNDAREAMEAKR